MSEKYQKAISIKIQFTRRLDKYGTSLRDELEHLPDTLTHWRHLYATSAEGKDLSNDTQIGVIGLTEPEICPKMLKNLSEKLIAKCPAISPGYFMIKIARLDDASLKVF